jgi:hypothetical protein
MDSIYLDHPICMPRNCMTLISRHRANPLSLTNLPSRNAYLQAVSLYPFSASKSQSSSIATISILSPSKNSSVVIDKIRY